MIPITKDAAAYVKSLHSEINIPKTCRQKSKGKRKKRSIEDTALTRRLIDEYEKKNVIVLYDSRYSESK